MPNISTSSAVVETTVAGPQRSYGGALAVVTTLFFMWGFLTCLNDILIPHLKSIFDLNYAQTMLIQFTFFSAYFLMSIPSSRSDFIPSAAATRPISSALLRSTVSLRMASLTIMTSYSPSRPL